MRVNKDLTLVVKRIREELIMKGAAMSENQSYQPIFKTARLLVKKYHQEARSDIEHSLAHKVLDSLTPEVTKSLPNGWQNINTLKEASKWIKDRDEESTFLQVQLLDSHELVGFLFLFESESLHHIRDLRFGYLLAKDVWGQGFGTELVRGLVQWCEETKTINSISGGVETNNIGSIKVLEKCGFSPSGTSKPSDQVIFFERRFSIDQDNS